jgi:hypothetical protein
VTGAVPDPGRSPGLSGPLAGLLACGGLVMLLGSGPTLLAVGLAAQQLHGTRWVAGPALAFAAWSPTALLAAQALSGMCMSALEGDMDARVATTASPRGVTAALATAAALRAGRTPADAPRRCGSGRGSCPRALQ